MALMNHFLKVLPFASGFSLLTSGRSSVNSLIATQVCQQSRLTFHVCVQPPTTTLIYHCTQTKTPEKPFSSHATKVQPEARSPQPDPWFPPFRMQPTSATSQTETRTGKRPFHLTQNMHQPPTVRFRSVPCDCPSIVAENVLLALRSSARPSD